MVAILLPILLFMEMEMAGFIFLQFYVINLPTTAPYLTPCPLCSTSAFYCFIKKTEEKRSRNRLEIIN